MTVRAIARASAVAVILCAAVTAAHATGLNFIDKCGRSVGGSTDGSPADPLTVDSAGNVMITNYMASVYQAGEGQCDQPASDGTPVCTLSASQTKVPVGTPVTLFAKCSFGTASLSWIGPATGPSPPPAGSIEGTITFNAPGVYSYGVNGTNSAGAAGHPSAPLAIQVGTPGTDAPQCQVSVSPQSILQGGTANLRVVCQPEATSYQWDTAEAGAPAAPASTAPFATLGPFNSFGAFTYKVAGTNAQGTGPKTGTTIAVASTLGCNPGPVNTNLGTSPPVGTVTQDLPTNGAVVIMTSFVLAAGTQATFEQYQAAASGSYFAPQMKWSVSPCQGDFAAAGTCNLAQSKFGNMVMSTVPQTGACIVQPGVTYYLNMKQTTCSPSGPAGCAFALFRIN